MNIKNPLFKIRTAADWIDGEKSRPVPKMLFSEFWLEGELAIMFADTGKGKSILAVEIAEALATGASIAPFVNAAPPQKVLYLDFELTAKQFEMRYAADNEDDQEQLKNHYEFSPNFFRAEIVTLDDHPRPMYSSFDEYLTAMMIKLVRDTGAKVLIIDNLTYLKQRNENTAEAARLMKALKEIRTEYGLSVLVLAHTPKRALASPLTVNDLQGSKILSNFADNIFAIGCSMTESDLRYLKHIKLRSTEMQYDALNVPVFRLVKRGGNFLSFQFLKIEDERRLLGSRAGDHDEELLERIRNASAQGMSQRAVAAFLGISKNTVTRYLRIPTAEERRLAAMSPEERHEEMMFQMLKRQVERNEREAAQNGQTADAASLTADELERENRWSAGLVDTPDGEDNDSMPDDECDCHECLSGNPDKCLVTDWSQQCCDGTDPNCCARAECESPNDSKGEISNDEASFTPSAYRRTKRRTIHDLEKRLDEYGKEAFVEKVHEKTGQAMIFYTVDGDGHVNRWVRQPGTGAILGERLGKAPYID